MLKNTKSNTHFRRKLFSQILTSREGNPKQQSEKNYDKVLKKAELDFMF
jgi:hypothetical protein